MRLSIRHETRYRYGCAPTRLTQLVRLTPASHGAQRVVAWRVVDHLGGDPFSVFDAWGNQAHLVTRRRGGGDVWIVAEGEVERTGTDAPARERHPPAVFLRTTGLTEADAAIVDLAHAARGAERGAQAQLRALARLTRDRLTHRPGTTGVATTAAAALADGAGVCQDRAHVFLAAARTLGHPARYVSGYLHGAADEGEGAMHAWVEAYAVGAGWIALDPSTGEPADSTHVRVAIGLDYGDAAPLRGVRRGGEDERMSVAVRVHLSGGSGTRGLATSPGAGAGGRSGAGGAGRPLDDQQQ